MAYTEKMLVVKTKLVLRLKFLIEVLSTNALQHKSNIIYSACRQYRNGYEWPDLMPLILYDMIELR